MRDKQKCECGADCTCSKCKSKRADDRAEKSMSKGLDYDDFDAKAKAFDDRMRRGQ